MKAPLEPVTPVEVVRPRRSPVEAVITAVVVFLLRTWLVMLGLGVLFPWMGISFAQTTVFLLVLSSAGLANASTSFLQWTRPRERAK